MTKLLCISCFLLFLNAKLSAKFFQPDEHELYSIWQQTNGEHLKEYEFVPDHKKKVIGRFWGENWGLLIPTEGKWAFDFEKSCETQLVINLEFKGINKDAVATLSSKDGDLQMEVLETWQEGDKTLHSTSTFKPISRKEKIQLVGQGMQFYPQARIDNPIKRDGEKRVTISGAVRYPGVYCISQEMSLVEFIKFSGLIRPASNAKKIIGIKKEGQGKEVAYKINYYSLLGMTNHDEKEWGECAEWTFQDGDIFYVPFSSEYLESQH